MLLKNNFVDDIMIIQHGVVKNNKEVSNLNDINISHLTKDYGHNRGVFDVSIQVDKGECFGFLGPNGAGKTTTIRHLMGFSKPQEGSCEILGLECFKNADIIKNKVGYLPGEVELPENMKGNAFLKMMFELRHLKDDSYLKMLIEKFDFNPNQSIKRMSLGVKRKLAVVNAFMHDPDILILDEPTSGLDPVMQQTFIEYILEEKQRGKTIFLSSHIFSEVDATCDRIAIIKDGRIASIFVSEELKDQRDRIYQIVFKDKANMDKFRNKHYREALVNENQLLMEIYVNNQQINSLISDITQLEIVDFNEIPFSLEDYFMQFYENKNTFEEVQ